MVLFLRVNNSLIIAYIGQRLNISFMKFMPYPCSQFCADVKFDNRFDIELGDSFHVNHTINFGIKLRSYGIV